jgi:hypothetical protein
VLAVERLLIDSHKARHKEQWSGTEPLPHSNEKYNYDIIIGTIAREKRQKFQQYSSFSTPGIACPIRCANWEPLGLLAKQILTGITGPYTPG